MVLVGDGVARYQALFDQLARLEPLAGPQLLAPPPEALARLASPPAPAWRRPSDPADVLPDYLREADAPSTGSSGPRVGPSPRAGAPTGIGSRRRRGTAS